MCTHGNFIAHWETRRLAPWPDIPLSSSWHWANQSSFYPKHAERIARKWQVSIFKSSVWLDQVSKPKSPISLNGRRTLYSFDHPVWSVCNCRSQVMELIIRANNWHVTPTEAVGRMFLNILSNSPPTSVLSLLTFQRHCELIWGELAAVRTRVLRNILKCGIPHCPISNEILSFFFYHVFWCEDYIW